MTEDLLLDTHIALWLDSGDERLRAETRELIDRRWKSGGTMLLSAVTAWEIALLADTGRIALDLPAERWVTRFLERPGVGAAPLNLSAAAKAYNLQPLEHRDPADRLLIATSIEFGCSLVTYDRRIVQFAEDHGRRYGFSVEA